MKTNKSMKSMQRQAITWGRFSSDKQADGDSKDRQERLNRECAKRAGIEIVAEHFDAGVSVKDGATPLFRKVIADLPAGVGIICENLDRISRGHSFSALNDIYNLINDGHFIITSQDGKEYNQDNIEDIGTVLTASMSAILARSENNKRTKRVREAKAQAVELARQGKAAPLGKWLPAHIKYNPETKQYDIREDRRKVIERIFKEYANGKGVVGITKGLNEDGILTFRGKGKLNGWQRTTVFCILRYEGVIGIFNYKDERIINAWQPAISEKLFYKVQAILETNKQRHGNYASDKVNNILRGLCKCPHCGSGMIVTGDRYLACAGYQQGRCTVKNMLADYHHIEHQFAQWFVPTAKDALLGKDASISDIEALQAKRIALQGRMEQTVALLDKGYATDIIEKRLAKLTDERDGIDNEIASTKAKQTVNAALPESFDRLNDIIDGVLDNQEIRKRVAAIVPTIVKRVDIDIKDKFFPSFAVHLINNETIKWEYQVNEFGIDAKGKGRVLDGHYEMKESK
jgi:DNA invertase Pin-like site-specific DNA recombinase